MKKRFSLFSIFLSFLLLIFAGCSKEDVASIKLIKDDLKTQYIVGDTVEFEEISLQIIFKDESKKNYFADKDMITIKNVDNTTAGSQVIKIIVKSDGDEKEFSLEINFSLPEEINQLIEQINNLPPIESLTFDDEELIDELNKKYNELDEIYIKNITNQQILIDSKEKISSLESDLITIDVINKRNHLKTNFIQMMRTYKENDYSKESWIMIQSLYEEFLEMIELKKNYNKLDSIMSYYIEKINAIKTIKQLEFLNEKENKIREIRIFADSLNKDIYSNAKWQIIEQLSLDAISQLQTCLNDEELVLTYNNYVEDVGDVKTLEIEKIERLNTIKTDAISELNLFIVNRNLLNYSEQNRSLIQAILAVCERDINASNNEKDIFDLKAEFIIEISAIKTIVEEEEEAFVLGINAIIYQLKEEYSKLYLYDYDSTNKALLVATYNDSLNSITNSLKIDDAEEILNSAKQIFTETLTMYEQAQNHLLMVISDAKKQINEYVYSLNINDYSASNWQLIMDIASSAKTDFDTKITIYTSDSAISKMISDTFVNIDNVSKLI